MASEAFELWLGTTWSIFERKFHCGEAALSPDTQSLGFGTRSCQAGDNAASRNLCLDLLDKDAVLATHALPTNPKNKAASQETQHTSPRHVTPLLGEPPTTLTILSETPPKYLVLSRNS
eukprot:102329-Amphidinium_carterae.1